MGLILDSSILIAAERAGFNARRALTEIANQVGNVEVGISVVSLVELAHGASRANTFERRSVREQFLHEIVSALPVYPVTAQIALRAGLLDGEIAGRGQRLALSDLLIGVTALDLGHGIATSNRRHFEIIPGLNVVTM